MPKNKSAAIRYRIIDQCINNKRKSFPSLEYLANHCANLLNTDVSPSTIEKDIAVMTDLLRQASKLNTNKPEEVQALADASYAANQSACGRL